LARYMKLAHKISKSKLGACRNYFLVFVSDHSRSEFAENLSSRALFSILVPYIKIDFSCHFPFSKLIPLYVYFSSLIRVPNTLSSEMSTPWPQYCPLVRNGTKILMAPVLLACYHNSLHVRSYLLRAAFILKGKTGKYTRICPL
jgi:hypothetical protein